MHTAFRPSDEMLSTTNINDNELDDDTDTATGLIGTENNFRSSSSMENGRIIIPIKHYHQMDGNEAKEKRSHGISNTKQRSTQIVDPVWRLQIINEINRRLMDAGNLMSYNDKLMAEYPLKMFKEKRGEIDMAEMNNKRSALRSVIARRSQDESTEHGNYVPSISVGESFGTKLFYFFDIISFDFC